MRSRYTEQRNTDTQIIEICDYPYTWISCGEIRL